MPVGDYLGPGAHKPRFFSGWAEVWHRHAWVNRLWVPDICLSMGFFFHLLANIPWLWYSVSALTECHCSYLASETWWITGGQWCDWSWGRAGLQTHTKSSHTYRLLSRSPWLSDRTQTQTHKHKHPPGSSPNVNSVVQFSWNITESLEVVPY